MSPLPSRRKSAFLFVLFCLTIFPALILAELYVRYSREYVTPALLQSQSLQYESALYSRFLFPEKEQRIGASKYFINKKGFRGKLFSTQKKEGTLRIIIYGGSAVFDQNVHEGKDWPHRIEALLHTKGFTNVEVINAGIPGNASIDSFGRLFSAGHILQPDYILLYHAWNDIKYFSTTTPLLRSRKSYRGHKDPRVNYQNALDQTLCELSQLYVRLRSRYYHWKYNIGDEGMKSEINTSIKISQLALKQFQLNVEMFVDMARNIGAVPILMTQARLITSNNSEEEKFQIKYDYVGMNHETLLTAFQKTDEIIKKISKAKNVALLNTSRHLSGKLANFTDHVHLTDSGSQQLAKITTKFLLPLITEGLGKSHTKRKIPRMGNSN